MKEQTVNYELLKKIKEILVICNEMKKEISRAPKKHITYSSNSNKEFQAKFNEIFYLIGLKDTKYETLMQSYWIKADTYYNGVLIKGGYLMDEEIDIIIKIIKLIKADFCGNVPDKIFISHSSEDKDIVSAFVKLLETIGLTKNELFCSSVKGYDVLQGKDIYEYLRNEFVNEDLFVVFMLSENYYKSAAALNEMGATWILKNDYQSILLPKYKFEDVKGAVNPMAKNFHINDVVELGILKDRICRWFNLSIDDDKWNESVNKFTTIL